MYQNEVKRLGLSKYVRFLGQRKDVLSLLKCSKLFVLPTNYEGMSNSILEAMACNVPIITTNIAENKELLRNHKDALLVDPKDSSQLAEAIVWAINNTLKMQSYAKSAAKKVNDYDIKKTAVLFEQKYQQVINR